MSIVKRVAHVLIVVLTLLIGATAAAVIVSQTAWFKNWLRGYIVREAQQYLNGTLSIERLSGNLFFGVEMENIGLSMDGSQVVAVKDLGLDYNAFELLTKGLSVDSIRLNKPVIYLRREGDTWSLSRLVKKQATEADRSGPERPIAIDDIGITDGSVVVESPVGTSGVEVPKRIDQLDARLSFKYEPVRYSIEISHVSFRGSDPALALNALSGGIAVKDDTLFVDKLALSTPETSLSFDGAVQNYLTTPIFRLSIASDKLSVPEVARVVPALAGIRLQPSFNIKTDGPLDHLAIEMNVQSSAGTASGKVVADFVSPGQSVQGDLTVRHLDLSALLNDPKQKSDITANARVDLHGAALSNVNALHGTVAIDSARVMAAGYVADRVHAKARIDGREVALDGNTAAYGTSATVAGKVTLPDFDKQSRVVSFDLRGKAGHLDLRKLPRQLNVPQVGTDITAAYHAAGSIGAGESSNRHRVPASGSKRSTAGSTSSAMNIAADLTFEPSDLAGTRISSGSTAGVTVNGSNIAYRADANVEHLDLQRIGEQFHVPALADARYRTAVNGHIAAEGNGTTLSELTLSANGTLSESSILGGTIPQLAFTADVARDTVHLTLNGSFSDVDLAGATGKPEMKGHLAGALDGHVTLSHVSSGVTADSVEGDARLTLQPSAIGDLAITRASVDATYRDAIGEIRTLDVVGQDLNVRASGTVAMNDTGQSNLKVHADSPNLETLARLVDWPVTGIGAIDATLTGNRHELKASGNLVGDGVKYGDNGALTISSTFNAVAPELEIADATVVADTHATFVSVAGQDINEVDAKTTYKQKQLDFDATAKQPQRSLSAGGALLLHPDHQEVHLQRLGLQAQGRSWQLAPDSQATVNYGHDAIAVKDLTLVSGNQRIAADGTFGQPGDALKVTLTDVDLASVDAMLLRPPQLSGTLTASGTVTGATSAPNVDAEFRIDKGGFQQYRYDSFGGTVKYAGRGLTLDTKLQQNATTYVTAKGYVPTALFKAGHAETGSAAPAGPAENGDRIDFHIDSTPIDVGLVQGFIPQLTKVTGTVQARIDVTGSAADPRPSGVVSVDKAAFTVATTGVAYTNLQGKIELQPDKVHIDNIYVLDNHHSALSITGDMAIRERELGNVELFVTASDFKVVDNKLGNVRVNTNLEIAGELRAPRVEGDFGVSTGVVNLDEIAALASGSAYATQQTEYVTPPNDVVTEPASSSPMDAFKMDVRVTVPEDLVVKASELRTPGAPVSLGAINITLGGDLRATKEPGKQIVLVGAVNTVRGTYDFQGRRFEILRDGTVRFGGEPLNDLNPLLDIRTRRLIQGVEARVNVRGTLKQPEIVLTSTPPLEQADILSLIVFNQPINSLAEGQRFSLAQRAQQLATGSLTSALSSSIENALGVDTFAISTAPESGANASVTIGQQVGKDLYVKVEQSIGGANDTNFILEYELTRWLRLRTNMLQGGTSQQQLFQRAQGSGADLLFFFSY